MKMGPGTPRIEMAKLAFFNISTKSWFSTNHSIKLYVTVSLVIFSHLAPKILYASLYETNHYILYTITIYMECRIFGTSTNNNHTYIASIYSYPNRCDLTLNSIHISISKQKVCNIWIIFGQLKIEFLLSLHKMKVTVRC